MSLLSCGIGSVEREQKRLLSQQGGATLQPGTVPRSLELLLLIGMNWKLENLPIV